MRVLLADDHTLVRAGIRGLVEAIPGVEIVAETGDGQQALALILERHPDIALVDVSMPGLNGLELAARVAREAPRTRIAILSMHGTPGHVAQALRAGVKGYVLKDAAAEELPLLLRAVMRGETYLSPAISKHVVDAYLDRDGKAKPPPGEGVSLDGLTPRQREILQRSTISRASFATPSAPAWSRPSAEIPGPPGISRGGSGVLPNVPGGASPRSSVRGPPCLP